MTREHASSDTPPATLVDAPVAALVAELARGGRVPGAGSVSAVVTAMAAAVVAMAARASGDVWREAGGAVAQAEALRARALPLADADARALEDALTLFRKQQEDQDEEGTSEQRDFRLGTALATAAEVPLSIAQVAADVAALAYAVAESGSAEVRPDAAGAAVLASGAAHAASHLVEINLATTDDDLRVLAARSLCSAAADWAEQALALRD